MSSDNVPEQNSYDTIQPTEESIESVQYSTEEVSTKVDSQAYIACWESYSGPLPPLNYLQYFESVHKGSVDIILESYVEEQKHRHIKELKELELKNKQEDNRHAEEVKAIQYGFWILIIFILSYIAGLFMGVTKGIVTAVGTVIISVVAFILYKRKKA